MARANAQSPRVAYVMSRFPKLTETFVLDEILELERAGVCVDVFPLWRERTSVVHPDARPIVARACFTPTLDFEIARDNLRAFVRAPRRYLATLATLVRANAKSTRFLVAALAIFPKAVSFARRMRERGVVHVHAHFASHPAAAAFVVGRLSGIPWSFTAHGSDLHREQAMLREKVAAAHATVAISDYNRRFILDRVGHEWSHKVNVIHCGVELGAYRRRPVASGPLEIVCVGTLHAVKGQRYLLEACAELETTGIDWRCHLVGDGEDRSALEARAQELGIDKRVVFHGSRERDRVRALLAEVDIAVAPSVPTADGRREGIPVALIEAAAASLPLVGSRLSGIPELVRDEGNGLLVEPGDAAGLARALIRLAREPHTRARFGAAARRIAEREFDLAANVQRLRDEVFAGTRS